MSVNELIEMRSESIHSEAHSFKTSVKALMNEYIDFGQLDFDIIRSVLSEVIASIDVAHACVSKASKEIDK